MSEFNVWFNLLDDEDLLELINMLDEFGGKDEFDMVDFECFVDGELILFEFCVMILCLDCLLGLWCNCVMVFLEV